VANTSESNPLASFRCVLSRSAWLLASDDGGLSPFFQLGCGFYQRYQFWLRLFCLAVVMLQRLDARSFFYYSQLSVGSFLAFFLKVFRNRLSCHGSSVAELSPCNLSHFDHSHDYGQGGSGENMLSTTERPSRYVEMARKNLVSGEEWPSGLNSGSQGSEQPDSIPTG
jgi:hypothetical protein